MKIPLKFVVVLLFVVLYNLCCSPNHQESKSSPPSPVYFSKNRKTEIGFPTYHGSGVVRLKNNAFFAFLQTNKGLLQSVSDDNGFTWNAPKEIFRKKNENEIIIPIVTDGNFLGVISHKRISNGGQLYFYAYKNEKWQKPGSIRDTNWGNFSASSFAIDSVGNYYCVLLDWRDGNADIYFSSSSDNGKTWSKNVRIDDDLSGQEQINCKLLSTPDGVLFAIWQDNRNLKTLYDIYFSKSKDGGKTWSPDIRINDDTTHTWQVDPSVGLDQKNNIYVVWNDFRKKGISGDLISNIYFSKSTDFGETWSPNIPISHGEYYNTRYPQLKVLQDNSLHCIWGKPIENPQTDILHSYSINGGKRWSEPALVNDDFSNSHHDHRIAGLLPDNQNDLYVGWIDWRNQEPIYYFAKMLQQPDSLRTTIKTKSDNEKKQSGAIINFETGDTLFVDDFKNRVSKSWREISGIWVLKDEMYIGYNQAFSVIDKNISPEFSYSGRFLLDPLNHRVANIYFQFREDSLNSTSYYRLMNIFRSGTRLEYFNGNSFVQVWETPFRFQKDTWYSFKTVVKKKTINYFINDSLLFALDNLLEQPGKLGVGAGFAPTYFKEIEVLKIK